MPRGNDILRNYAERIRAEKEQQTVTEHCWFCKDSPKPWSVSGVLGETRSAYAQHLATVHPEVKPKPRRQTRYTSLPKITEKSLEENIVAARQQGASGWAGPIA